MTKLWLNCLYTKIVRQELVLEYSPLLAKRWINMIVQFWRGRGWGLVLLWTWRDLISMDWKRCCRKDGRKAASSRNESRTIIFKLLHWSVSSRKVCLVFGRCLSHIFVIFDFILSALRTVFSCITSWLLDKV